MNMKKFQNKYRVPSARLEGWDYGSGGWYFVTVCTAGREHHFGKIKGGVMTLSPIGKIAQKEWEKTPGVRSDMNLTLGEFVVMPNHLHLIIGIGENRYNAGSNTKNQDRFGSQSKNIGSIMRGYKSAVTTFARVNKIDFAWQPRFYDHIIRTDEDLEKISEYIRTNPMNWENDELFP
jgi:putative transposase